MATKYWLGTATAVAQVHTGTIATYDAATTYRLTVGGIIVSTIAQGSINATATALRAAANASIHPYFSAVTWAGATNAVIGTADVAGVRFVASLTVSGGTGTVVDFATTTSSAGPNDWNTAANWSDGVVPVSTDNVIIADSNVNISQGLDQSAVDLNNLTIEKTYIGKIGLNRKLFTTDINAEIPSTIQALEYRQDYLKIGYTTAELGINNGPGNPQGSGRIKIDNDNTGAASDTIIYSTSATPSEAGLQAIRLKFNNSTDCNLFIRSAPGGVGIATDKPGETSLLTKVSISDESSISRVFVGEGTTLTTWEQFGGNAIVQLAATLPTLTMYGGTLTTEGDYTVTSATVIGGTWYANHIKTAGVAITTLNIKRGIVDTRQNTKARTFTTFNLEPGGSLRADGNILTITAINDFAGPYALSMG